MVEIAGGIIQRTLSTLVVVAVFLGCVLAGSASAESAWIHWLATTTYVGNIPEGPTTWSRESAHESLRACEGRANEAVDQLMTGKRVMWDTESAAKGVRPEIMTGMGDHAIRIWFPELGSVRLEAAVTRFVIFKHSCWPETIDPRK